MKMTVFCKSYIVLEKAIPHFTKWAVDGELVIDPMSNTIELTVKPALTQSVADVPPGTNGRRSYGQFDIQLEA